MATLSRGLSIYTDYNCSWDHDPQDVVPNGDISGPGVLIGFLGPAYFVVLVIVVYYLLVFNPDLNPFQSHPKQGEGQAETAWRPNPIDTRFLRGLRSYVLRYDLWQPTRDRIKLLLEEKFKRIITGFGILVSGFYCLKDISAYHWQIIVYLAWFANITHIATLTFLRDYLHSRKDLQERNFRVFMMLLFLLLLLVAELPTGFFNWVNDFDWWEDEPMTPLSSSEAQVANASSYAKCFFNIKIAQQRLIEYCNNTGHSPRFQDTTAFQGMIISMVLLVFNFGSRAVKLSMTLSYVFNRKVRATFSQWFRHLILRSARSRRFPAASHWPENRRTYIITKPLMALFLLARFYLDLGTSTLAEVYWLIVSTIWGSFHLFMAKNSKNLDDGSITFGQVLPVALLIAPLLSMVVAVVQLHRQASSNLLGSDHGLDERRAVTTNVGDELAQSGPSLGTESQPQWLTQSYYAESWMRQTTLMAIGQIASVTSILFSFLSINISVSKTFASMLIWVFFIQPASLFFVILLGLAVGSHAPHHRPQYQISPKCLSFVYWLSAAIILCLYSYSPIWLRHYPYFGSGDPVLGNYFLTIYLIVAGGVMFLYCIVCCILIRSPADGDEEQIEVGTLG